MTALFVTCIVAGFAVAALGMIFDGVFDVFDVDLGPDWLSLPVLGVAAGAFGVTGTSVLAATGSSGIALIAAIPVAVLFLVGTARLMLALMRARTDATPNTTSVVGAQGRVVTPVIADGLGEVLLRVAGHTRKFTATADEDLPVGTAVVAVESISDTSVRVMSDKQFWGAAPNEGRYPQ